MTCHYVSLPPLVLLRRVLRALRVLGRFASRALALLVRLGQPLLLLRRLDLATPLACQQLIHGLLVQRRIGEAPLLGPPLRLSTLLRRRPLGCAVPRSLLRRAPVVVCVFASVGLLLRRRLRLALLLACRRGRRLLRRLLLLRRRLALRFALLRARRSGLSRRLRGGAAAALLGALSPREPSADALRSKHAWGARASGLTTTRSPTTRRSNSSSSDI